MTTKEQELKALAQIKKIVESLGADSYIGTAFEGCFEIAEENIENDFACSMKQRWESATERGDKYLAAAQRYSKEKDALAAELGTLRAELDAARSKMLSADDLVDCRQLVDNEAYDAERDMKAAALDIVTFAEEPAGTNFQDAVRTHRAAASRWNYLLGLKGRIEKAIGAGV